MLSSTIGSVSRALLLFCLFGAAAVPATEPYTIAVRAGAQQTFVGFGASQVSMEFGHFAPEPHRSIMADLVYRDLKAKILRLWLGSGPEMTLEQMKTTFYADYIDNGVIPLITARGVDTLLLAPARGMEAPTDSLEAYSVKLAQFIFDLKKERGITIHVTGVANEPEGWSGEQLRDTIKFLRAELDARGLHAVGIIAPENPSANDVYYRQLEVIRADPKAWAALVGVSSHSYNMAVTDAAARLAEGKEYWMTESSEDGNEQGLDADRAAALSARFLNDLNHRVTHWIYFKGFSYSPDVTRDDYTGSRLTQYDGAAGKIVTHLKYHYLKNLLTAFDAGAVFRRSESASEADMVFTYGQKPRVCAAAGVNPDGTWSVGVVNITGVRDESEIARWHPAQDFTVTLRLEELRGSGSRTFRVRRSNLDEPFSDSDSATVVAADGVLTLTVGPRELVCLRSVD